MTAADLLDLLITRLTRATGKSRAHWRRALGPVKLYSLATHPSCNWRIEPSGSASDVEAAQTMLDTVRSEHPHIG